MDVAKRGVLDHEKTIMLADCLGIVEPFALGVLEAFWQWVAKFRPSGDLTTTQPALMARSIRYVADPQHLWESLIRCRWIDREGEQLRVHDWADHAEDSVHMRLARALQPFADGKRPCMNRIPKTERVELESRWDALFPVQKADSKRTESAQEALSCSVESSLPLPLPKPMPEPKPLGAQHVPNREELSPSDRAIAIRMRVVQEGPISGMAAGIAIQNAAHGETRKGGTVDEVADRMLEAWRKFCEAKPRLQFAYGAEKFFGEGNWLNPAGWPWKQGLAPPPKSKPMMSGLDEVRAQKAEARREAERGQGEVGNNARHT